MNFLKIVGPIVRPEYVQLVKTFCVVFVQARQKRPGILPATSQLTLSLMTVVSCAKHFIWEWNHRFEWVFSLGLILKKHL